MLADPHLSPERRAVLEFLNAPWPPADPHALYRWGWSLMPVLGKAACLRAVLASYEARGLRSAETDFDRSARRAAEAWVLDPQETTRASAGRIAATRLEKYSYPRMIANLASRRNAWRGAVSYGLVGNPHLVEPETFARICAAISSELRGWASGERDFVAERHALESRSA